MFKNPTETYRYRYDDNGNETFRIWEKTAPTADYPGNVKLSGTYQKEAPTVYEWRHYDGFNQLIRTNQDDKEITYQYRADGLRHSILVRKQTESQGKTNLYCWDGSNIVADQADDGKIKTYLRGINLIAREIDRVVYYYIFNEHGDVTQLWSQNGTCKVLYEYDAFGIERNLVKEEENPFRYCGEYYDLETNTYYLRARNYDPTTGRFLSEDPAKAGLNLYTYCSNNPIVFVDPSGLVEVNLFGYAKTYEGSTITYDKYNSCYTVMWDRKSFTVAYDLNDPHDLIDDSVFVKNFGVGTEKLVVYQDDFTGNVSIRANFNITGKGADSKIDGTTYRALFLQGVEDNWSGTFGSYAVSTYTGESSEGIKVNINDKLGVSNMKSGLFGWSKNSPGKITMYNGDSRGDGNLYSADQFLFVSAHEFGHILGVGDAYNSKNSTGVTSIFNGFGTGAQEGDIAMVLKAWSTGKWQKWP